MKRIIIAALLTTMSVPALAQSAPPVAFQVSPTEYDAVMKYLGGQPYANVAPVIGFLESKERAAQSKAVKAKTPKPSITSPIPTFNGKPNATPSGGK